MRRHHQRMATAKQKAPTRWRLTASIALPATGCYARTAARGCFARCSATSRRLMHPSRSHTPFAYSGISLVLQWADAAGNHAGGRHIESVSGDAAALNWESPRAQDGSRSVSGERARDLLDRHTRPPASATEAEGSIETAQGTQEPDAPYALGHSERELKRLTIQARLYDPFTEQAFRDAGITAGVRVLDVGCGAGDVSFLAARLVGPTGEVVGVDRAAVAVATASRRAHELHLTSPPAAVRRGVRRGGRWRS
jgi:Methyltransferase domain